MKKRNKEKVENLKELLSNEDLARMWMKLHTPIVRNGRKVGRNEICPYCNSGKKFKNCECYKTHQNDYSYYKPNVR